VHHAYHTGLLPPCTVCERKGQDAVYQNYAAAAVAAWNPSAAMSISKTFADGLKYVVMICIGIVFMIFEHIMIYIHHILSSHTLHHTLPWQTQGTIVYNIVCSIALKMLHAALCCGFISGFNSRPSHIVHVST
jgi:hypothetical protein